MILRSLFDIGSVCWACPSSRAEVLQSYAQKLATRALEDGQAQQTDPMSNSERKIIHRIVSKMEGVTSYSEGEEPNRYVVVDIEG